MISLAEIISSFEKEKDYTIQEVADAVGISYSGVLGAVKRGVLPARRVFSRHYINGSDVIKYLTK